MWYSHLHINHFGHFLTFIATAQQQYRRSAQQARPVRIRFMLSASPGASESPEAVIASVRHWNELQPR